MPRGGPVTWNLRRIGRHVKARCVACLELTATACAAGGGEYQGDNTTCSPNPCPQPPAACCFADGHCETLGSVDCTTAGGGYQGAGTTCEPNLCPQPGACCFADGHCEMSSVIAPGDCAPGGTYVGDNTDCDPNPCPQPGACCFGDGHCEMSTVTAPGNCAPGGTYVGDNTDCDANPCPQPGACCFGDGHCEISMMTAPGDCALGGTYLGDDTDCDPNPCPQPGACCFEDDHCEMSTVTAPGDCTAGGTYLGDNTDCEPNPCGLAEGLVGYWQFDEGSGSVAHDSSGYGNDGAIYGGATWVEGVCGGALDFDGSSSYVQASTVNVDYLTVSAWVRWEQFYADNHGHSLVSNATPGSPWSGYLLSQGSDPPYNHYSFVIGTTGSTQAVGIDSTLLNTEQWYHIVVTYDGQWLEGYLDGQFVGETAASGTVRPATNPLLFGRPYYPRSPYTFNGTLDEVRIYNRALTATEVWELYQSSVLGACCFASGLCQMKTAAECQALGGQAGEYGTTCTPNDCPPCVGDLNCDGVVDFGDINPFVLILSNFAAWQQTYPGCPWQNGDINGDGNVGFEDINPFVALIVQSPIQCQE